MARFGRRSKQLVLTLHLICAGIWVGAILAMIVLLVGASRVGDGAELAALHRALIWLEYTLIIPTAFGSLISGALLCWGTNWGFFRYRWIVIKWIVTIALILFGALALNGWVVGAAGLAGELGLAARQHPDYQRHLQLQLTFVPLQWAAVLYLVWISVGKGK